jgi:hypothetical protein
LLEQRMQMKVVRRLTAEEGLMLDKYLGKEILAYKECSGYYYGKMTRNGLNFIELENVKFVRDTQDLRSAVKAIAEEGAEGYGGYRRVRPLAKRMMLHKQAVANITAVEDVDTSE